jgi:hypothetical protein
MKKKRDKIGGLLRWGGVDGEKVQELVRWRKLQKLAGEWEWVAPQRNMLYF